MPDSPSIAPGVFTAEALRRLAEVLERGASPQSWVDVLVERVIAPPISLCYLMLFGSGERATQETGLFAADEAAISSTNSSTNGSTTASARDDGRADGPYDVLEMQGRWSQKIGSASGLGTRLYIEDYRPVLDQLDRERVRVYADIRTPDHPLDALTRGYVEQEGVRSLLALALGRGDSRLGVLMVGTDVLHTFSDEEIIQYRFLADLIALNVQSRQLLEQKHHIARERAALLDAMAEGVLMVVPGIRASTDAAPDTRFARDDARVDTGVDDGRRSGVIHIANEVFCTWFGMKRIDLVGMPLMAALQNAVLPEDIRTRLMQQWGRISPDSAETYEGEFAITMPDGRVLELNWHSNPVYAPDGFVGALDGSRTRARNLTPRVVGRLYSFYDVSAARTAERLRSAFLSRVSHELRTPLQSISGFAEFILTLESKGLPDRAREYLEIILSKARHLSIIFTDMIEMTRADAGEVRLRRGLHHIPDAIIESVAGLELQYKERQQQMRLDLDDDLPPADIDYSRVVQVFTNVVSNAIKYAPEGSTITVTARLASRAVDLGDDAPPDVLLPAAFIRVEDEGRGLTAEEAGQVFMPFFRTETARKGQIEGAGLGLAVTRSLLEVHRGRIWVVPTPRATGGWFHMTIPVVVE